MSLKDPIRGDSPPSTGPGPTRPLLLPAAFAAAGVGGKRPPPATQPGEAPLLARLDLGMLGLHPRPGDAYARSRPQAARHPQDQRAR